MHKARRYDVIRVLVKSIVKKFLMIGVNGK